MVKQVWVTLALSLLCTWASFCAVSSDAANPQTPVAVKKSTVPTKVSVPARTAATKTAPGPVKLTINVPCRAWVPKGNQPKVVLLCVHGLGLNSDSYEDFGKRMAKAGIATFAVDVRGFGSWMQRAGKHNVDFKACLTDIQQTLKVLHTAYPSRPVIVLGESMGGAIAMRLAADRPDLVQGLISSVPSADRFHTMKNKLRVALKLVTFRANKEMDVGTGVIDAATDNPVVREKWKEDPLNRMDLSAKDLIQFQNFMNSNHETAKRITTLPVLFVVGLSDRLVKPEGTIELYKELPTPNKKMITIRSAEHLIFEEGQCSQPVFNLVVSWLKSQSK
jgi:acylglycerol lipase